MNKNNYLSPITLLLCISSYVDAFDGPAGIGNTSSPAELVYWIDANNGLSGTSPISVWNDLSASNANNTIIAAPALFTNAINGRSAVNFNGANDRINTNLSISESVFKNLSIISVYKPDVDNAGAVWGEDDAEWDRFILDSGIGDGFINSMVSTGTGPRNSIPNIFPVGSPVITTVIFQEDITNGSSVFANHQLNATFASNHGPEFSNNLGIGHIGTGGYTFDGLIAEVIIFRKKLNAVELIILHNYLSAKYEIPLLSGGDIYDQDLAGNGNFDFDVAGIGRDNSNAQTDSQGTGILRVSQASDLNANEYLIWGHNNNPLTLSAVADVPLGVIRRMDRVWRVNEVNSSGGSVDVGAVNMSWDLTGVAGVTVETLRLLIDTDNDGSFNDETPISGAINTGGNIFQFSSVPSSVSNGISNDRRFTLAIVPVPNLTVQKRVSTLLDPVNGTSNPKAIPGAIVEYEIKVTNNGLGIVDSSTLIINDTLCSNCSLYVGDINGADSGPIRFEDGTVPSGLSYVFTGLSSSTDGVDFFNLSNVAISPTPDSNSLDSSVARIKISTNGTMTPFSAATGSPSFSVFYRLRID